MKNNHYLLFFIVLFLPGVLCADNGTKKKPDWTDVERYKTRFVKRVDAKLAYNLYKNGKAIIISVDTKEYYKKMTSFVGTYNYHFLGEKNIRKVPKNILMLFYCR